MCEILAPAGGIDSALAAINAGADAIYLGLSKFSARSSAENFDLESFKKLSAYARALKIKVYVAMNTLVKDGELKDFLGNVVEVWNCGASAIILSDIFLGKYIKEYCPEIKLHLSTQAGVCNTYGAVLAKKYGFERVILSRETSFEDIRRIASIIETEVFVQGALCAAFSGQCYMSSFAGGNSGNRGKCKQPCRKLYSIDRCGYEDKAYRLSLSDLCVGENLDKYVQAGVKSFKIEGRMRRPEYVSAAVEYYKAILSGKVSAVQLSNLKRTYNRGNYTRGLSFGQDKSFISSSVQGHLGEFVGVIKVEHNKFKCVSELVFQKGDCFKILRNGREIGGAEYVCSVYGGFIVSSGVRLLNGDKVFVTTDTAVNAKLLEHRRTVILRISVRLVAGERAKITVNDFTVYGSNEIASAKTRALTVEEIKKCFEKVDKYPFTVVFNDIYTDGAFVAASELNALRRKTFSDYFNKISENKNKIVQNCFVLPEISPVKNNKSAIIARKFGKVKADIGIFKPNDYFSDYGKVFSGFQGLKFLYLPPYMTGDEIEKMLPLLIDFDGVYCDGIWAVELAEKVKKLLFAGCGFNISNVVDVCQCPAEYFSVSKELTAVEQSKLSAYNAFALSCGSIKLMDLIYCPFEKSCKKCDKRKLYSITDSDGRKFPLRRYVTSECRFEVYNCADLIGVSPMGKLIDCSLSEEPDIVVDISDDLQSQKKYYKNYTRGHSESPIL